MGTFANPVLTGSHPNPSVVRVGDDYYLATSTFDYFPAIALHHSRDLVHWRPIGNAIDRVEQLREARDVDFVGLLAPALREHDGVFYVLCTLIGDRAAGTNFILTATDPAGPWSDPVWLPGAGGFDPSLFVDGDGRAWFCCTEQRDPVARPGVTTVWLQELDLARLELVGERTDVWSGALVGSRWAEGPHVFERGGSFYLLTAEGGTEHGHAIMIARADTVTGPYVGHAGNPVLTHRHLGLGARVVGTGHADLVQTPAGDWWAVLLAMRPYDGYTWNLGRETFLTPVTWEDDWPVFNAGVGRVLLDDVAPALAPAPWTPGSGIEHFDRDTLDSSWLVARIPVDPWWSLRERPGHLRMQMRPESTDDIDNPSFVGRRQQHGDFTATTVVDLHGPEGAEGAAGVMVRHGDANWLRVEVSSVRGERVVRLLRREVGTTEVVAARAVHSGPVQLRVQARGQQHAFLVRTSQGSWQELSTVDGSFLSASRAGGFFGVTIGMFASSGAYADGAQSTAVADFDWFDYTGSD